MNPDNGLSALPSSPLSESLSAQPTLKSGEINDPIAVGLASTSASSLGDFTPQSFASDPYKSASSRISNFSPPIVQVQVAPSDLMALGMPSTSLPQPNSRTASLSTDPVASESPGIGVAPVVPTPAPATVSGEIAFIDSSLPNYQSLVAGVRSGVTVVILEGDRDGIAQITKVLKSAKNVSAIHLISPGDTGALNLGVTQLTVDSLDVYGASLQGWASALTPDADILLYGSNVGAGAVGTEFMQKFSQLTTADIAASTNPTGSANLGGDWDLEKTVLEVDTGVIAAKGAFRSSLTSTYSGVFTAT